MSATPPTTISPAGSLAGYSFRTWLSRNKENLKLLVSAGFGYFASLLGAIHDPGLNALASVGVGVGMKLALDGVDFWLSPVVVPAPQLPVAPLSAASVADAIKRQG